MNTPKGSGFFEALGFREWLSAVAAVSVGKAVGARRWITAVGAVMPSHIVVSGWRHEIAVIEE